MRYCQQCFYTSDHPLNIIIDDEGVCSGCRVHEEKYRIDWRERGAKLKSIFDQYRCTSGRNYDCVVPVSGARDSYYIVHAVKNIYGMNPLLVTYNKHYNTALGVRNLANLRIRFDCDIMTKTVSPDAVKKITRSTLRRFGSLYWHCLSGQTVFPVQIAAKFKIPLIVWGAHQGIDQVGMFSHLDEVEMTRKYRKEHDLMGYEAEDLIDDFDQVNFSDIEPFVYPENREIEQVGIRGIYLNNFMFWDSRIQHEEMIKKFGYETAEQTRTFDTYNDVDCWNYSDVHDYIKWLKHGVGKVIDHACREIRLKRLEKSQGQLLIKKYLKTEPKNLNLFLDWLGITEEAFHYIIDQHRNPKYWNRDRNWKWEFNNSLFQLSDSKSKFESDVHHESLKFKNFCLTGSSTVTDLKDKYILIGRGHD